MSHTPADIRARMRMLNDMQKSTNGSPVAGEQGSSFPLSDDKAPAESDKKQVTAESDGSQQ